MFDEKAADVMREQQQGLKQRFQRAEAPELEFNVQDDDGTFMEGPGLPPAPQTLQAQPETPYAPQLPPQQYGQPQQQFPQPPSFAQEDGSAAEDVRMFPGGPYLSQVSSWKKQFGQAFMAEINDEVYIFRILNRFEYKQIMATPNLDPLQREEIISEVCTLYPSAFTFEEMSAGKAGVPAILSEQILDKSGFTRNISVRSL